MTKYIQYILFLAPVIFVNAQNPHYNDDLGSDFHKERRRELRKLMPNNSVAVFFANPIRNRANDTDFLYHQDPNFYYLTGHKEPHSVLFIFKSPIDIGEERTDEIIFVFEPDELHKLYNGSVPGSKEMEVDLGLKLALGGKYFKEFNIDFNQFDKVMFYDFFDDYRDHKEEADLFELVNLFKRKVGYKSNDLSIEPKVNNLDVKTLDSLMTIMRGIKTKEELSLIRKAVDISTLAQVEVMKAMKPGMSESEIQGLHEYIFKKYRAEYEGYASIVGAGHNGCVLHYVDNYDPQIEDRELILMDLGAEYHGYSADVTRTIPVNGKFNKEQKVIYELVLQAQESAMKMCKADAKFRDLNDATKDVINRGLVELGLYEGVEEKHVINPLTERNRYYPHGCCHHIGLDVHDKGDQKVLKENMVITIEPGIYIPVGSPVDKKWHNIAVRIEDDFLITKEGCELLSDKAPRTVEEIENLMSQPSPFDAIILPELEEK